MSEFALHLRIEGHVQGVCYRAWAVEQAGNRALRGWVRNRRDGSVEAVVVGPEKAVRSMVAACHEGPPAARVADIIERPADFGDVPIENIFEKRATA